MKNKDSFDALLYAIAESMADTDMNDKEKFRRYLEYNCKTEVTDEDMLQIHIDYALDTGNKEMFLQLTGGIHS